MLQIDFRRRLTGAAPRILVCAVAGALGFGVAYGLRPPAKPKAPPPLTAAQVAALQHAAFTQAEAQPGFDRPQNVPVKVRPGETLEGAVARAGVGADEAHRVVEALSKVMDTVHIKAGMAFEAAVAEPRADRGQARLIGLSLRTGPATALTVSRSFDGALRLRELEEKVREETTVADGEIEGSLYESAAKLGATPAITAQVVKLFAHKLDFERDIHAGDDFRLVFDREVTESGRTVAAGDLKYAELHGVKFFRFERKGGDVEYLDAAGKNIKGFLLRTPVDGAHITSLFGRRKHPVLGYTRAHQGVDFGAGTGTPILAAGDGVVLEARRWAGYGNWLRIRHSGAWDTGYGHISRYAKGIRPGVHVRQGQVVAYVGSTGLATGPHLHYEVWSRGARVNPLSAKVPQGTVLAGAELARFRSEKAQIERMLAQGGETRQMASVDKASLAR
jgi:murein DD-endopeptidase MepM/ murein hydrolase activator NlpD